MAATAAPSLTTLCCGSSRRAVKASLSMASSVAIRAAARMSSRSQLDAASQLRLNRWIGLKNLSTATSFQRLIPCIKEKKRKCYGKVVKASLFGVGAPEALVIGVVALLVFGPKGLAEVARNLGKTLRAFQPTIKELQEVSREFKSTLEREIGLDEVSASTNYANKSASSPAPAPAPAPVPASETEETEQSAIDPNGKPSNGPKTVDDLIKMVEKQRAEFAEKSRLETSSSEEQLQVSEASSGDDENYSKAAENSQEPPTGEDQAQNLHATKSEGETTVVGEEPKALSSELPSTTSSEIASSTMQ